MPTESKRAVSGIASFANHGNTARFGVQSRIMKSALFFVALGLITSNVAAQQGQFRWVTARTESEIYEQVKVEFASELAPDPYDAKSNVVRELVKSIERIGLRGNSSLVIIGEKESKTDPYTVFRAFSFDLRTKTKSPVRSKGVEWLWMWRFEKVAHFTLPPMRLM